MTEVHLSPRHGIQQSDEQAIVCHGHIFWKIVIFVNCNEMLP